MGKSKFKSIYMCSVIISAAACLTACGKKNVDYDISTELATGTDIDSQKEIEEIFAEDITVNGSNIHINAVVDIPDTKNFNVYSARKKIFDEDELKRIVDKKFGGVIYDMHKIPKKYAKQILDDAERQLEDVPDDVNPEDLEYLNEYYQEKLAAYENAPDDWEVSTDYANGLVGAKLNGNMYYIYGDEGQYGIRGLNIALYDILERGKEEGLLEMDKQYGLGFDDDKKIEAKLDAEIQEYLDIALSYIEDFGLSDDLNAKYYSEVMAWEYTAEKKDDIPYGYRFTFCRKLDGAWCDASDYDDINSFDERAINEFEVLYIMISPYQELISLSYYGALEDVSVNTKDVKIIDYNIAKELILDELMVNPRMSITSSNTGYGGQVGKYSYMTLEYMRIRNKDAKDEYSIIPVWCLRNEEYSNGFEVAVVVNAIDGSIVDLVEELHE